jgi:F0F1-type ATP synthase assembly protein I
LAQVPGTGDEAIKDKIRAFGTFAGLGIQLGATVVVFFFLGYYLDRYSGTLPLFTILGTFIGAGAAFYSIYRRVFPDKDNRGR